MLEVPIEPQIDIRDTVDYKGVMREYKLGPNGAIVTSLNLFATQFAEVMKILEKRAADSETRRRGARDLVHAMCKHHDATTTKICGEHVAAMLGRYGASPGTEWRAKDAALHLVVSLAVRAESSARGVSKMSDQLDILEIYSAHVAPELGGATATHGCGRTHHMARGGPSRAARDSARARPGV